METGTPEIRAYGEFGRRIGLGCYIKFASLLGNSVSTGGKDLRRLLEEEMETAFPSEKRTCAPKRRGGVHKASDPDVSHAGSCDGHGGGTGIFVTVETEKKILSVLAAWWKMPAAGMGRSRRNMGGVCMQLKKFLMEEDGVGVIEVVLILVVLIGLVIVFKTQINKLLTAIFTEINKQAKEVY